MHGQQTRKSFTHMSLVVQVRRLEVTLKHPGQHAVRVPAQRASCRGIDCAAHIELYNLHEQIWWRLLIQRKQMMLTCLPLLTTWNRATTQTTTS